jgi:hypothetical protein
MQSVDRSILFIMPVSTSFRLEVHGRRCRQASRRRNPHSSCSDDVKRDVPTSRQRDGCEELVCDRVRVRLMQAPQSLPGRFFDGTFRRIPQFVKSPTGSLHAEREAYHERREASGSNLLPCRRADVKSEMHPGASPPAGGRPSLRVHDVLLHETPPEGKS